MNISNISLSRSNTELKSLGKITRHLQHLHSDTEDLIKSLNLCKRKTRRGCRGGRNLKNYIVDNTVNNQNVIKLSSFGTSQPQPIPVIRNTTAIKYSSNRNSVNHSNLTVIKTQNDTNTSRFVLLNARSIGNKVHLLQDYIAENNFDLCAITETWLKEKDKIIAKDVCPPGYKIYNVDRENKKGGGVALIYKSCFKLKPVQCDSFNSFEYLSCTLASECGKFDLCIIYRPPSSDITTFTEDLSSLLDKFLLRHQRLLIAGDFNVHVNETSSNETQLLHSVLNGYSLVQNVNFKTHMKGNTLDLIITRDSENLLTSEPFPDTYISDHVSIVCNLAVKLDMPKSEVISSRNFKNVDIDAINQDILNSDLMKNPSNELDSLVSQYNNTLTEICNSHAPTKTKKVKARHSQPWLNTNVTYEKRCQRKLERKWRKSNLEIDLQNFKTQRYITNKAIFEAKIEYFSNQISEKEGDKRALFHLIKSLAHTKKDNVLPESRCNQDLANKFNSFFTEKIEKIRKTFPDTPVLPTSSPSVEAKMSHFRLVTEEEVIKLINRAPSKSCSQDPIPTTLLKKCLDSLIVPITKIINLSLENSAVPQNFKQATITPLLKKEGAETIFKNYRPISNLSYLSKLLERVVNHQVREFTDANNLNEPLQSAYRPNHSTEAAVLKVVNDIFLELDKGNVVLMALLDLSAAFDTVDHTILLERLQNDFGISDNVLNWYKSYLTGRTQTVTLCGSRSSETELHFSVPQGSVLGPDLYVKYTKKLSDIIKLFRILYHFFADDSQLYKSLNPNIVKDQIEAFEALQNCILNIIQWMQDSKLKLNEEKTEFIIFGLKTQKAKLQISNLQLGDTVIKSSESIRDLGAYLDSDMSMRTHVCHLSKVCFLQIRNIRYIRPFLTTEACKLIVNAVVTSRLDYCNGILIGIPDYLQYKLQRIQNCAARLVFNQKTSKSMDEILKDLHWLKIKYRIQYKLLVLVFKALQGTAPQYLSDCIILQNQTIFTRSKLGRKLYVPKTKLKTAGDRAFSVAGPKLWNTLPAALQNTEDITCFKKLLKTHMFKICYDL